MELEGNEEQSSKSTFDIEELTSEDDIYLFHNFKYFKQSLLSKNIDINNITNTVEDKTFEILNLKILDTKGKNVTLVFPSKTSNGCLVTLPLTGHLCIEKDVQEHADFQGDIKYFQNELENEVKFPEGIKVRHPLLGVDWKKHINLADASIKKDQLPGVFKGKKHCLTKGLSKDVETVKFKRKKLVPENSPPQKKLKKGATVTF